MISKMTARLLAEAFGLEAVLRKAEADGFTVKRPLKEAEIAEKKAEAFRSLEADAARLGVHVHCDGDLVYDVVEKPDGTHVYVGTAVSRETLPGGAFRDEHPWPGNSLRADPESVIDDEVDWTPMSQQRGFNSVDHSYIMSKGEAEASAKSGLVFTDPIEDLQKETAELRGLLKRAFEDCAQTNKAATELMASMGRFEGAVEDIRVESRHRHEKFLRTVEDESAAIARMAEALATEISDDGPMIPRLGDTVVLLSYKKGFDEERAVGFICGFSRSQKGAIYAMGLFADDKTLSLDDVAPLTARKDEDGVFWRWPNDSDEMPGDDVEAFAREMEKVSGLVPEEVDDEDDLKCAPDGEVVMDADPRHAEAVETTGTPGDRISFSALHGKTPVKRTDTISGVPVVALQLVEFPDQFDPQNAAKALHENDAAALIEAFTWNDGWFGEAFWDKTYQEMRRGEPMNLEARQIIEVWLVVENLVVTGVLTE